jgi:hypothetical protein
LLKKQLENGHPLKRTPPVNYAEKVSGTYIGYEIQDYINGETKQIPADGISYTFKIDEMSGNRVLVTEEFIKKGLLGGRKGGSDNFKAKLSKKSESVVFTEIWEKGEYESYGTFVGDEFELFTKKRSDGAIISRLKAKR